MGQKSKVSIDVPRVGECFVDDESVHWKVRNLILSDSLENFFLVSMDHGTIDHVAGTVVLSPLEFEALVRTRGLKATRLDTTLAIPVAPAESAPADGRTLTLTPEADGAGQPAAS